MTISANGRARCMNETEGGVKVLATRGGTPPKDSDFGLLESERVALRVPVLEPH